MAGILAKYTPQAVRVPAGVRVERSFAGFEIGDEIRALCDRTTIFCDVFRVPNADEVVCIGPPFSDFGYPRAVRLSGRRRRFVVEEAPWGPRRMSSGSNPAPSAYRATGSSGNVRPLEPAAAAMTSERRQRFHGFGCGERWGRDRIDAFLSYAVIDLSQMNSQESPVGARYRPFMCAWRGV